MFPAFTIKLFALYGISQYEKGVVVLQGAFVTYYNSEIITWSHLSYSAY